MHACDSSSVGEVLKDSQDLRRGWRSAGSQEFTALTLRIRGQSFIKIRVLLPLCRSPPGCVQVESVKLYLRDAKQEKDLPISPSCAEALCYLLLGCCGED